MKRLNPLPGEWFGWLQVMEPARYGTGSHTLIRCKCICGTQKDFRLSSIAPSKNNSKRIISCGCLSRGYGAQKMGAACRTPSDFRAFLSEVTDVSRCAWCLIKFTPEELDRSGRSLLVVDHLHDICHHRPSASACFRCVRGLVHQRCNLTISYIDEGVYAGYIAVIDDYKRSYLTTFPLRNKSKRVRSAITANEGLKVNTE